MIFLALCVARREVLSHFSERSIVIFSEDMCMFAGVLQISVAGMSLKWLTSLILHQFCSHPNHHLAKGQSMLFLPFFIFLISNVSWVLVNITSESSHCFRKGNRYSGCRLCIMVCPSFWEDYYMLIYTHCWELMNSVGSHGSLSLPFVMKVMVWHFVSDSHEVMTALIVVLPLIVVVEISLQLHQSFPSLLHFFFLHST